MNKSKSMVLSALFMTMLLVGMALVPVVSAQGAKDNKDKKIVEVIQLQPEAGSEVILDSLQAKLLSDGSVMISGSGEKKIVDSPQYFHWEVNLSKKTYKTIKLDPMTAKEPIPTISREEVNKTQAQNIGIASISPGNHWAVVWVETVDPVYERLAETTNRLEWTVYSGGTVGFNLRRVTCWAANPTSFDTHWYIDSCGFVGGISYSSDYTSIFSKAEGKYHNYDWGIDSWATYEDQWSQIQGKNDGNFLYTWDTIPSGEDWFLLNGNVYADGG